MVAGCRFWGEDEEQAAQDHARRRGQLGVEALLENGGGAGEQGGLRAGVQAGGRDWRHSPMGRRP